MEILNIATDFVLIALLGIALYRMYKEGSLGRGPRGK